MGGTVAAALWLVLATSFVRSPTGELSESKGPIETDIELAGREPAVARVRSVITELLEREGVVVSTSRLDRIQHEAILAPAAPSRRHSIGAWIDIESTREVQLYFRDASAQRFVVRRLALENGLDEIAVEEVGQVVKSVVLALAAGDEPALTFAQARAILQPADHEAPKHIEGAPTTTAPLVGEVGVGVLGQLFSPEIRLSPRLDLRLALLVDHRGGPHGSFGGWLSVGYGDTLRYRIQRLVSTSRRYRLGWGLSGNLGTPIALSPGSGSGAGSIRSTSGRSRPRHRSRP